MNSCQICHLERRRRVKIPRVLFFLSLLSFLALQAQQSKGLEGRVHSRNGDVSGTHILNISSNKGTITDGKGFFSIAVKLNDTLVFSAIQLKRKELVVNSSILESKLVNVYLEDGEIRLDEVLVMPYNLTGDLSKDLDSLKIGSNVSASTLGLPNANVKVKTQNERKLFEADNGKFIRLHFDSLTLDPTIMINLNKILNRITGRTKKLKKYVAIDREISLLNEVKTLYLETRYVEELMIPNHKVDDFLYFCAVDSTFHPTVHSRDQLKIWEFIRQKSVIYRKNNNLE